jgi:hypothetical protein
MISLYFTVKDVFFFNLISLVQTIELKKKKKRVWCEESPCGFLNNFDLVSFRPRDYASKILGKYWKDVY